MKRKADARRGKALFITIIAVAALAAAVIVMLALPKEPDIKAKIVSIRALSVSEETENYILNIDGSEFGYDDNVYILINEATSVRKSDGKSFLPQSFIIGDVVEVYYVKETSEQNVITAKKIVMTAH